MTITQKRRILYIVQHRFNRSPGQRYRCEQYLPFLEQNGFECVYSPIIINEEEDKNFYSTGNYFSKLIIFSKAFFRRLKDNWRAKNFDIIYIYREAFMTGTVFFEQQFKKSGAKIIFDFDDAIWNSDVSEGNKKLAWLKRPEKINEILGLADTVFAGNKFLANYASSSNKNVVVFPSTIDLNYYKVPLKTSQSTKVVIGWSGSQTTIEHFKTIIPVLLKLKEKYANRIGFVVYGVPEYTNDSLEIKGTAWSHETEVSQIATFDIGIMPLPNTEWSKGKCGMKGLQYMALEVPAVMAAVGENINIIQDGVNGFLASTEEEWLTKLSFLIESKELRNILGKEGRKTIEANYSVEALKSVYLSEFRKLLNT